MGANKRRPFDEFAFREGKNILEIQLHQRATIIILNFLGQKVSVAKFAQVTVVLYCLFTALALWKLPTG